MRKLAATLVVLTLIIVFFTKLCRLIFDDLFKSRLSALSRCDRPFNTSRQQHRTQAPQLFMALQLSG